MRFISLSQAAVVGQLAASVLAHPSPRSSSSQGVQKRVLDIAAFKYKLGGGSAKYVSNVVIEEQGIKARAAAAYTDIATAQVKSSFPDAEFRLVSSYQSKNGLGHVVFRQTVHGIDIDTADFNVNVKDGKVFSYGNSFYSGPNPAESPLIKRDQVDPVAAVKGVSTAFGLGVSVDGAKPEPKEEVEIYRITGSKGALSDPEAKLVYFTDGSSLTLSWRVETDVGDNWLLSYVDAVAPEKVLGLVDYVAEASYTVYPWKTVDPSKGSRVKETNPWDIVASEFTWHSTGLVNWNTTRGNNGNAQTNWLNSVDIETGYRPVAADLNFNYEFDINAEDPHSYANASVTQLFYTANMYHDLLYVLGFNEEAGNFEANNNGQGGRGGDAVTLNAQDGSGTNNANFATPVDGQPGRMRMYIWDFVLPKRDCSFDASVVIHEYTHGLSNRLTGGPLNSGCLATTEAGGMGEGWSDFMAIAIGLKTTDTRAVDYPMGDWIRARPSGIRTQLYSTSTTTNNMTYETANGSALVHFIGTIWAETLYEVLWNLIDQYGMNDDRHPTFKNGVPTDGRFLAMQLVIDGMKLQPCRPNFIQARDGIIDADKALTGGKNACLLWKAFAKRGLGAGASRPDDPNVITGRKNSFNLPSGVCGCNADNCLRALRSTTPAGRLLESQKFCGTFTKTVVTDVSLVKSYLTSACTGNVISRVSSACGCIPSSSPPM